MRVLAGIVASAALLLVTAGCGGQAAPQQSPQGPAPRAAARAGPADATSLAEAPCPATYEVAVTRGWTRAEVRRGRERASFEVDGVRTRLRAPVDWSLNTANSRSFRHQLHKMKWTDVLFSAYLDGDVGALRQAQALFGDWIGANPLGEPGTPAAAWADKRTGDRAPYMAFLLRAGTCEGILNAKQQRILRASLRLHAAELSDPAKYKPTNHGLFEDLGLALLAEQLPFEPDAERWARLARQRFQRTLLRRLHPQEGLWLEHSADYQVLLSKLVARFSEIETVTSPGLGRIRRRMERVTAWLVEPDGQLLQSGDSDRSDAPGYIDPDAPPPEGLLALRRSGLAVAREGDSYLALQAGFHNSTHKHSDELSFDLYEGGEDSGTRIVSDTGLYNKDFGPEYEFAASARAHSGLIVDGVEPSRAEADAYGSGLLAAGEGDGYYAMLGTDPLLARRGVRHHRLLIYRPGSALIVVDGLRSPEFHDYERLVQLGADLDTRRRGDAIAFQSGGVSGSLSAIGTDGGRLRPTTVRGARDPLGGLTSPSFRRWLPRTTVGFNTRSADADLAMAISLGDAPESPRIASPTAGARGGSIRFGGQSIRVVRRGDELIVRARPQSSGE